MALGIAFRAFFAAIGNATVSDQFRVIMDAKPGVAKIDAVQPKSVAAPQPKAVASSRSDAVALLGMLQREARLVDLIQENLSAYSDAQVGAAARPCLIQCASALQRTLGIEAIEKAADGVTVTVPASASPSRVSWIGEATGGTAAGEATGKLVHHGWQATRVELPKWTGDTADANVIAPVQIKHS